MVMNKWSGKMAAGTIAAAVLLGGFGGFAAHPAFADDDESEAVVVTPDTSIPLQQRVKVEWNTIISKTASILDAEDSDIYAQLEGSRTLGDIVQAQGYSPASIVNQVTDQLKQTVTNALNQQLITDEEAASLGGQIGAFVGQAFETPAYKEHTPEVASPEQPLQIVQSLSPDRLAVVLGITSGELTQALQGGQTIADIAKGKGISEEALIAKLKDELTPALQSFIHQP